MPAHLRQSVADPRRGVDRLDRRQMGHTNGNMIRQHYGTWINEDGPDVVGMLQLALKLSPITARPPTLSPNDSKNLLTAD